MAESPSVHKDRVLACSVYCNGSKLKDEYALVAATVHQELNRIGKATLKFNAGNIGNQTFDESDADLFKPGNAIRLDAGDTEKEDTLFDGVIIGLRIIIDKDFRSYMLVECRDHAYSATQGRKIPQPISTPRWYSIIVPIGTLPFRVPMPTACLSSLMVVR